MAKRRNHNEGLYERPGESRYWWYCFIHPKTGQYVRKSTKQTIEEKAREIYEKARAQAWDEKEGTPETVWTIQELIDWCEKEFWTRRDAETPESAATRAFTLRAPLKELGQLKTNLDYKKFRQVLRNYRQKRELEVQRNSINREFSLLLYAFNKGCQEGYLSVNPFVKMNTNEDRFKRDIVASPEQKKKLVEGSKGMLNKIIRFALVTGMRQGEIRDLKPTDFDFIKGVVKTESKKGGVLIKRVVPLRDRNFYAMDIIAEMDMTQPYVFHNGEGQKIPKNGLIHAGFPRLTRRLGMDDGKGFHFHDIRHTFATEHWLKYRDIVLTSTILGHRDIKTTMRYINLAPEDIIPRQYHIPVTGEGEDTTDNRKTA